MNTVRTWSRKTCMHHGSETMVDAREGDKDAKKRVRRMDGPQQQQHTPSKGLFDTDSHAQRTDRPDLLAHTNKKKLRTLGAAAADG